MPRKRLDILLVERSLADDIVQSQCHIQAGRVFSGTTRLDKIGEMVADDVEINIRKPEHNFVSRGGEKLSHALNHFSIDVTGLIAIDVGSSTGGFTDVLLQKGASKVYAVDVGHGQLDWKLRNDARVVVMEKTNARHLTDKEIPEPLDLLVCDASFISIKTVLPAPLELLKSKAQVVTLIKPQFEVAKKDVKAGGVVKDSALHERVCHDIKEWFEQAGWNVIGIEKSPLLGPKGNTEFLLYAKRG
jgi:23S rRNA (cytidine1920-2'-O)/16S rRNA (cytidine1409-2'-O)-methyltransferase